MPPSERRGVAWDTVEHADGTDVDTTTAPDVQVVVDLAGAPMLAWRFLTDHRFLPTWYPGVTRLRRRSATRMVEHRRLLPLVPLSVPVPMRVVESSPGSTFAVRARLGLVTIDGRYDVTGHADGAARVTISYRVTPTTVVAAPTAIVARRMLARDGAAQGRAMPRGFAAWLREHGTS